MKHIKLFENFVFEALGGLVTSKYDLDDFLDALDKRVNAIYSSGNVRNRKATFLLAKDGNLNNLTRENIIECVVSFVSDNKGVDGYYTPVPKFLRNHLGYNSINLNLPIEKSSYNKILSDYTFIHEFSHSIDPIANADNPHYKSPHYRSDRIARKNGYENFASMKRDEKANELTVGKAYISDETEREAYPDGIAYLVRGLLSKNPGKKEALKDLIRMKDWHIEKVFPELDVLMASLKNLYDYSQYYRDKLIRRISELVINDTPTNLKKPAFIATYTMLSSITIKLLDPNNFKDLLKRSRGYETSIIKYHQNFEEIVGNGLKIQPYYLYPLFKVKKVELNSVWDKVYEDWVCICFFDSDVDSDVDFEEYLGRKEGKELEFKTIYLINNKNTNRFFKDEIIVQTFTKEDRNDLPHYMKNDQWPESDPAPSVMDIESIRVNPKYRSKIPLRVYDNAIINLGNDGELGKPMYKILSVEE